MSEFPLFIFFLYCIEISQAPHSRSSGKEGRARQPIAMFPVENGLANLILFLEENANQLSSIGNCREVIADLSFLDPLGPVCRKQQSRDHICLTRHSVPSFLPGTDCALDKQLLMNYEWVSGNFQCFKKPNGNSTFASIRWHVPNKIAFSFLFCWNYVNSVC